MMNTYIGIDLGTSSTKFLLVDKSGKILSTHTEYYETSVPYPNYSEQDPSLWIKALHQGLNALLNNQDKSLVKGISFGGQMHGLVILDEADKVIRPCILWNDGRTTLETAYLNEEIGKDFLSDHTANIAFAGFTLPKLLWLRKHEKANFDRIKKIMLPKDYLAYYLSGTFSTDYSDASGTLMLDVKNKAWSAELLEKVGISLSLLPALFESYDKIGTLKESLCKEFELSNDVIIACGASDNAAAAIGTGTINDGDTNISLGTSGTIFISSDHFTVDQKNALHSFDHASGKYHLMGCILSAASSLSWWMNILDTTDFEKEQEGLESKLGDNNIFYLPYLFGERSPHNDTSARGSFIGISSTTKRSELTLSVMEGVAFALRDCLEIARSNGLIITHSKICGGGAKSDLWKKIIANVLNVTVVVPSIEEGPAYGASILAMIAGKEYANLNEACSAICKEAHSIKADPLLVQKYEKKYEVYKSLYPALKDIFKKLS